ncbi:Gfo/Idh/MocA family protein [Aspergillus foveolatus]|uniref:Gfo/Idh/MocA family protein n=1 Tax=Aspergillus foveolatus TaxID=210207 RepID=UPI003CCDC512
MAPFNKEKDKNILIVIVGAGLIGPRHAQSVQRHPRTQLIAFVDPSPSAIPVAESFGVPCYDSITSMLDVVAKTTGRPDAAIVSTPNHTHVDVTLQLLENGIRNILLEKPISDDLESAEHLLATIKKQQYKEEKGAEDAKINILIGHHRRFNPYIQTTKSLLERDSLGTVIAVNGLWTLLKPASYFAPPLGSWRADKKKGGVLGINLIHDIDVLQFLFGPVSRVYAEGTLPQRMRENSEHTAEEGCAVTLRFASGVVGTFLICDATPSPLNFETGTGENPTIPPAPSESASDCYRILGTRASLSVPDMTRWSYDHVFCGQEKEKGWNTELGMQRILVKDADVRPFDAQWEYFVDVVSEKGEDSERGVGCSVEDGVRALRVVRAVRESMEGGKPVDVQTV